MMVNLNETLLVPIETIVPLLVYCFDSFCVFSDFKKKLFKILVILLFVGRIFYACNGCLGSSVCWDKIRGGLLLLKMGMGWLSEYNK